MKSKLNFSGKFLIALLIFLSSGNQILFGASFSEIREAENSPVEQIKPSKVLLWVHRENPLQEFEEPSQNPLFGYLKFKDSAQSEISTVNPELSQFGDSRDIRIALSLQLFPTHFFL